MSQPASRTIAALSTPLANGRNTARTPLYSTMLDKGAHSPWRVDEFTQGFALLIRVAILKNPLVVLSSGLDDLSVLLSWVKWSLRNSVL